MDLRDRLTASPADIVELVMRQVERPGQTAHPTDEQLDDACVLLRRIIDAAENGNDAGERALWAAYRALVPSAPEWR